MEIAAGLTAAAVAAMLAVSACGRPTFPLHRDGPWRFDAAAVAAAPAWIVWPDGTVPDEVWVGYPGDVRGGVIGLHRFGRAPHTSVEWRFPQDAVWFAVRDGVVGTATGTPALAEKRILRPLAEGDVLLGVLGRDGFVRCGIQVQPVAQDGRPVPGATEWGGGLYLLRSRPEDRGGRLRIAIRPRRPEAGGVWYDDSTVEVPLDGAAFHVTDLPLAAALTGVVRDPSGQPVRGLDLDGVARTGRVRCGRTDDAGRFRIDGFAAGTDWATVHLRGDTPQGVAPLARSSVPGEWVFDPTRSSVTLRAQDEAGAPIPDAWFLVTRWNDAATAIPVEYDAGGPATVRPLAHATIDVRIGAPDHQPTSFTFWTPRNGEVRSFALAATRRVHGGVVSADGAAVTGIAIGCDAKGASAPEWSAVQGDGGAAGHRFEISDLPRDTTVRLAVGDPPCAVATVGPGETEARFSPVGGSAFALVHAPEDGDWLHSGVTVRLHADGAIIAEAPAHGGVASFGEAELPERVDALFVSGSQFYSRAMTGVRPRGIVVARPDPYARFVRLGFRRTDGLPRGDVTGTIRHASGVAIPFAVPARLASDFVDFPLRSRWTIEARTTDGAAATRVEVDVHDSLSAIELELTPVR